MGIKRAHAPLLICVCASLFCTPFMNSGVNAVLPQIGESLEASARQLGLIGVFYTLGQAIFQLASGSLGDLAGRKRVFLWGIALFLLSSLVLGFLRDTPSFLCLRFAQGLGAALFNAAGLALVASVADPADRPAYLGYTGFAVYSGIAAGPPIAGFLTEAFGWPWIFWANALAFAVVWLLVEALVGQEWKGRAGAHFDYAGCLIYGLAMAAFTFGSNWLAETPILGGSLLLLFALAMALFALYEFRAASPLLDMGLLLRNRVFGFSSAAAFLNYGSVFGMTFFFSIYLQLGKGFSVQDAGLILALQFLAQAFANPFVAKLCRHFRHGPISACGAACCGCGLFLAAFLHPQSSLWPLLLSQLLLGAGVSLFALPNTNIILECAGPDNIGQASGLTGAARNAGQLFNMTFISMTLGLVLGNAQVAPEDMESFMFCMKIDLIFFGLMNILALFFCLMRNRGQKCQRYPEK